MGDQIDRTFFDKQANIMVQYTTDEAKGLLTDKLSAAKSSLTFTLEDLEFLKEQITTMDVK